MVECEYAKQLAINKGLSVLIDTWWNVNIQVEFQQDAAGTRFNRYMVECECRNESSGYNSSDSFNRYMVECECHHLTVTPCGFSCFNRYMVECELKMPLSKFGSCITF